MLSKLLKGLLILVVVLIAVYSVLARLEDVPRRFFETPTPRGQLEPKRVANLLEIYETRCAKSLT